MVKLILKKLKEYVNTRRSLFLYVISGISSLFIDYLFFITSYYLFRTPIDIAAPIGLSAGLVASFMLNKLLTFRAKVKSSKKRTAIQAALYVTLFLFNNLFTILFLKIIFGLGISVAIGKLISTGMITMWNYTIYKKVIFK